ncbi:hypothetical protein QUA56_32405 [Microcoleus sp. N3A4]|uniref:hypothetical protein n=1 Tax=Microcoleus sp. N3A4 TaxID=3055379 RepID=UPI002FD02907
MAEWKNEEGCSYLAKNEEGPSAYFGFAQHKSRASKKKEEKKTALSVSLTKNFLMVPATRSNRGINPKSKI